jgi:hypothetical protein
MQPSFAQSNKSLKLNDTVSLNKNRLRGVLITEGVLYVTSMTALYSMWYSDYPQTHFHWINDNGEWMQLDKVGHGLSCYNLSKFGYETMRWAGVNENKALWYGGITGFTYQTVIEILDGFSVGWGASPGDLIANTTGSLLFVGQQLAWHEQRFALKYSFYPTSFADYRPDLLGENFLEETQKDYNGMTLWLSANIASFLPHDKQFPAWLNIAAGYGATGMTGAENNVAEYNGKPVPHFNRIRQFYLSPDIDFSKIKTKSKTLKVAFYVLNVLKFPAPAIELNSKGKVFFHPVFY